MSQSEDEHRVEHERGDHRCEQEEKWRARIPRSAERGVHGEEAEVGRRPDEVGAEVRAPQLRDVRRRIHHAEEPVERRVSHDGRGGAERQGENDAVPHCIRRGTMPTFAMPARRHRRETDAHELRARDEEPDPEERSGNRRESIGADVAADPERIGGAEDRHQQHRRDGGDRERRDRARERPAHQSTVGRELGSRNCRHAIAGVQRQRGRRRFIRQPRIAQTPNGVGVAHVVHTLRLMRGWRSPRSR